MILGLGINLGLDVLSQVRGPPPISVTHIAPHSMRSVPFKKNYGSHATLMQRRNFHHPNQTTLAGSAPGFSAKFDSMRH